MSFCNMRSTIRLYDEVEKQSAKYLAWAIDDISRYGVNGQKCEGIDYRINSVGGYVTEGLGMYGTLIASEIPVNTYIDGVAMSMGLVIAQAGKKRYMASHAICMMHPVQAGADSNSDSIDKMNNSILDILSKRATCSREEMQTMMAKTTYLNAEECLALGLVDEIFDLEIEIEEADDAENLAKSILTATNKFFSNINNPTMETVAKAKYEELATNLADVKSKAESDLAAANAKAEDATNKLTEATNKLATVEAKLQTLEAERATNLIANAIAEGKIKEDAKNTFIEKATADFEGTKALLDGLATNRQAPNLDVQNKGEKKFTAAGYMAELQIKNQGAKV